MDQLRDARRINVTGNVAVGKSTVARALGEALDLPVVHLDQLIWAPGWRRRPPAERDDAIRAAAAGDAWIIDGVSSIARERADAIVFLDLPRRVALRRALARAARLRSGHRPELDAHYPEYRALRPALRLAWRFDRHVRPGIVRDLGSVPLVVRIGTPRGARRFSSSGMDAPRRGMAEPPLEPSAIWLPSDGTQVTFER